MKQCTVFILMAVFSLALHAFAAERSLPVCTVKALTQAFPGGVHYEIGLKQPGSTRVEPIHRVRSLAEAIHFVLAEHRHHTCRPAFPSERRQCTFMAVNQRLVLNYAGQGTALEPVAAFASQTQASLVLRQMRNAYLCN